MMSTSLGRALRTVLTAALALVALAAFAGSAMAELLAEETGAPAQLGVLNSDPSLANTVVVDAEGELVVDFDIAGSEFEPGEGFPERFRGAFCNFPEFAGAYVSLGLVELPWQPSQEAGPESREAGPTVWANILGAASSAGSCRVLADQARIVEGEFLYTLTARFCVDGNGDYALTGRAPGPGGIPVDYEIPSATNTWHLFSIGALGTITPDNEEILNVQVENLPDPSSPC